MEEIFEWDKEKNKKLIKERDISFEAIIAHIEAGDLLATIPGRGKYLHQKQFIVMVDNYVYIVPFVENNERVFLKTIIPSRQMTKRYLLGGDPNEEI